MKQKYNTVGVSIPDKHLEQAAKARAQTLRRSFSNYVVGLIEADLRAAPPASSGPENICAGKDVKMPKDLAVFVPVGSPPVLKTSPKRRK